ncbi:MAG: hypothetical protein RLY15_1541 [Bacteroidota bacterium]|jgi:hypothetical protein
MARPIKHNADYFSHDNNMRNDMKIKALRRKHKFAGYAIYIMMLELLTENDYFEIEWNEMTMELLTPDFDIDVDELAEIIDYCIKLNLFQLTNGYLHCDKLTARLEGDVLSRRKGYDSNNSKRMKLMLQKPNNNHVNVNNNSISEDINAQSKVKEIKENKSKEKESKNISLEASQLGVDTIFSNSENEGIGFEHVKRLREFQSKFGNSDSVDYLINE